MSIEDISKSEEPKFCYKTRILPKLLLEEELAIELELNHETKKAIEKYLQTGEMSKNLPKNIKKINFNYFLNKLDKYNLNDLKVLWERINTLNKKEQL
mgnify:CR=1 FL=1